MVTPKSNRGIYVALIIIALWFGVLTWALQQPVNSRALITYLLIAILTHLYTGLFITAHDAMHGTVAKNSRINHFIGHLSALLFSYNFYNRLFPKHHLHHRHVATDQDPDYHRGGFLAWYFSFLRQYISWQQIVLMAISFNVLKLWIPAERLIVYWMLPAVLSTLQLFYFGTYLPHRGEHAPENPHKSGSQRLNHVWAFISCYFFGYHYEHHASPGTPWWMLWKVKENYAARQK
ncbi:fatty acid desaturase [Roseivirga sp. UBA838]|uniref:fatty acid desaturase n=1 Tax=Roseivirga sp. UBA838 TaxID=1947393 RepID=UPI00257E6643|nr:fatty acid desaturase [Roseivirga sp. UBA838]